MSQMSQTVTISREELLHQIKLSYQFSSAVEGVLVRRIVQQTASKLHVAVEPNELQQAADQFRLACGLKSASETWQWLQKHGLSLSDFEEIMHTQILSSKLAHLLFADKIERFWLAHQANYAQAVFYEVIVEDADLAIELFYALEENEISFQAIARQYIQDPELRRVGGYRGVRYRKDLSPEISAAVFAAKPPQLLKPVITSKGAHLLQVEELIQPQLDAEWQQKIRSELFAQWLKEQIEQMDVLMDIDTLREG